MSSKAPFGTELGIAPPGVPAYSSDYQSANDREVGSYRHSWKGVYTGHKFQCVEYARRWLVMAWGVTFPDVHMAYEIFTLPHFVRLHDNRPIPVIRTRNGSSGARPALGSIIIWHEGGFFRMTGHVAVVVHADEEKVLVAEQNVTDRVWKNPSFARALEVQVGPQGEYTVVEHLRGAQVMGWLNLPPDAVPALTSDRRI